MLTAGALSHKTAINRESGFQRPFDLRRPLDRKEAGIRTRRTLLCCRLHIYSLLTARDPGRGNVTTNDTPMTRNPGSKTICIAGRPGTQEMNCCTAKKCLEQAQIGKNSQ